MLNFIHCRLVKYCYCNKAVVMNNDFDEDDEACSAWLSQQVSSSSQQDKEVKVFPNVVNTESSTMKEAFGFLNRVPDSLEIEDNNSTVMKTAEASALGSGNAIVVNRCQQGNPVLELIRSVPWQFADSGRDIAVDYILGPSTSCLFLSLRYHALKPEYIYKRLKLLKKGGLFALRILLCLVDVKDSAHSVLELTKTCLSWDVTLLLAFSNDEAATYLETFKAYQNKPVDSLQTRPAPSHSDRAIEVLSSVRAVNSTDAHTLLSTFGSISNICKASPEELSICPGIGGVKARSLQKLFQDPFLKPKS